MTMKRLCSVGHLLEENGFLFIGLIGSFFSPTDLRCVTEGAVEHGNSFEKLDDQYQSVTCQWTLVIASTSTFLNRQSFRLDSSLSFVFSAPQKIPSIVLVSLFLLLRFCALSSSSFRLTHIQQIVFLLLYIKKKLLQ